MDEAIVDQMELDDEEYRTFVGGRDRSTEPLLEVEMVDYLKMKVPSLRTGATLKWMCSRLAMGIVDTP